MLNQKSERSETVRQNAPVCRRVKPQGFTLIELLVVIAMIAITTSNNTGVITNT